MKNYGNVYRDYQREQDQKDALNFIGWVFAYLFVGLGFTMPLWGSLFGLF